MTNLPTLHLEQNKNYALEKITNYLDILIIRLEIKVNHNIKKINFKNTCHKKDLSFAPRFILYFHH